FPYSTLFRSLWRNDNGASELCRALVGVIPSCSRFVVICHHDQVGIFLGQYLGNGYKVAGAVCDKARPARYFVNAGGCCKALCQINRSRLIRCADRPEPALHCAALVVSLPALTVDILDRKSVV